MGGDAFDLIERDPRDRHRYRFPTNFPVGPVLADTRLVAAALRLADILDFDRERTPPSLFHYLLPGGEDPAENRSVREWAKHLAISNWDIGDDAITFRGRCPDVVVTHAVHEFCREIGAEISRTRDALKDGGQDWPFRLPDKVRADIFPEGEERYLPLRFELDDDRIYRLLMGNNIYDTPLAAVRELVQNAVDACRLRDRLTELNNPAVTPSTDRRIVVRYEEPAGEGERARLIVTDSGTGMDEHILKTYFLKVGDSFYHSQEFNAFRLRLRKAGKDFAPVSDFGIGFLSCFMLADRVVVETAHWDSPRNDRVKRTLRIDGPTRLMGVKEEPNDDPCRFTGTRVTLWLKDPKQNADAIFSYLWNICEDLPYVVALESQGADRLDTGEIRPRGLKVEVPPDLESLVHRIPVNDVDWGLEGEILLFDPKEIAEARPAETTTEELGGFMTVTTHSEKPRWRAWSALIREGFGVGILPGLPAPSALNGNFHGAGRVAIHEIQKQKTIRQSNIARTSLQDSEAIGDRIAQHWLAALLRNPSAIDVNILRTLPDNTRAKQITDIFYKGNRRLPWAWALQEFGGWELYKLARRAWEDWRPRDDDPPPNIEAWEAGGAGSLPAPFEDGGLGTDTLWQRGLRIILPEICRLEMTRELRLRVSAPLAGWQEKLRALRVVNRDFDSWKRFAEYDFLDQEIASLLWIGNAKVTLLGSGGSPAFNEAYRDRLTVFAASDIGRFDHLLAELSGNKIKNEKAHLNSENAKRLQRLLDVAGDLEIAAWEYPSGPTSMIFGEMKPQRKFHGPWRLEDLLSDIKNWREVSSA